MTDRASTNLPSQGGSVSLAPMMGVLSIIPWCRRGPSGAQAFEGSPHFLDEQVRLFPGREVAALGEAPIMEQLGIGLFGPALRRLVDLIGEGADGHRNLDAPDVEKAALVHMGIIPVKPRRGDGGVGQPVEGDIVEEI